MGLLRTLLCTILLISAGSASAAVIGTPFSVEYRYPDLATAYDQASYAPASFVAGPGLDTDVLIEHVTHLLVDLFDTGLTVTFQTTLPNPVWNAQPFNGLVFTTTADLQLHDPVIQASTTLAGFDISRLTLAHHQIALNWNGLAYHDGTVLSIAFADVPEPGSVALLLAGLTGLLFVRFRPRLNA
ncbi:MAG TPA: PEP-CTERM sorting domain-containing protein [Acetobacteraceae bacterium]|nr:PEP-CTERM sorting domain-containing protein [Acetobacteraceae bacterium]